MEKEEMRHNLSWLGNVNVCTFFENRLNLNN